MWGSVPKRARWVLACAIAALVFYVAINARSPWQVVADDIRKLLQKEPS